MAFAIMAGMVTIRWASLHYSALNKKAVPEPLLNTFLVGTIFSMITRVLTGPNQYSNSSLQLT